MSELVSPFADIRYGWSYGEDNWNLGMDYSLLTLSYLAVSTIKGVVSELPAMVSGDAYFNTTDNRIYYSVNSRIYSVTPPPNQNFYNTSDQLVYVFDGYSIAAKSYISQDFADSRYVQTSTAGATGLNLLGATTPASARGVLGLGTASTQAIGFFEPAITAGSSQTYIRGDKSLAVFSVDVRASTLSGLVTSTSTAVTTADTVLTGIGKLQAQVSLKAPLASPLFTGTPAAPTAAAGTNTTQLATTAFVTTAISSLPGSPVTSVSGKTGDVLLTKADVGLSNVDNTSDVNKPVSTSQQTALNLKANLASPVFTGVPQGPTAAAGTNTTQLATTAFVLSNTTNSSQQLLHLQDQKTLGTTGGVSVNSTTFQNRTLNTTLLNQIAGASLTTNIITLPAGNYYTEAVVPFFGGGGFFKSQIYNVTDSTVILDGSTTGAETGTICCSSFIQGYFTLTTSKTISVRYTASIANNNGLGYPFSRGVNEVYTDLRIWKV